MHQNKSSSISRDFTQENTQANRLNPPSKFGSKVKAKRKLYRAKFENGRGAISSDPTSPEGMTPNKK